MARAWMKAALAGMAIMAMTAPVHAADTIKIGVPGAHSGDLVSYGMPSLNAARIVADEYNAKGGILGKQIEIVAEDDQCKPELGTNAATKVLSEGAVAVMGSICSGATKAALPIYNDAKIVSISPSATTPELTQKGDHPYFFRTIASDDVSGHLAGSFAKDKLGLKKVALLHDKGDYGRGFVNYAREMLEKGGVQIVLEEGITPGAVDYGAVIQKIRKAGADGKDGINGKDGIDGKDGADGKDGTNGQNGSDGADGNTVYTFSADYDEYEGESIDKQLYTLAMPNDISGDEIETAAITETGLYHSSEEKNYHQYTSYISESFSKVSKSLISSELQKIEKAYGVKVSASKVAKAMQTVFDKVKETEYEYSLYEKKTLEGDGYTEVITLSVDGAMYEDDSLSAYIYVDRDRVYK